MKKMISILAAFACMLACCFALVGCGGNDTAQAEEFIGTWNLESVTAESSEMKVTASDVLLMQSFGYDVTLTLNADGTASFDLCDVVTECEWSVKDSASALLSIDGQKVDLTIDEKGLLKMSQGGEEAIFFTKYDPEAAKEAVQAEAAADSENAASSDSGQQDSGEASASTSTSSDSSMSGSSDDAAAEDSSASTESSATTDASTASVASDESGGESSAS